MDFPYYPIAGDASGVASAHMNRVAINGPAVDLSFEVDHLRTAVTKLEHIVVQLMDRLERVEARPPSLERPAVEKWLDE